MTVPFIDLSRAHDPLVDEIVARLRGVVESGQFVLGPETVKLEQAIAGRCGVEHGVAVASGTDALLLALQATGIKPGDEVVTTPFTFIATATAIARAGARPVFADISPETFNLSPVAAEAACGKQVRAILAVDLYGLCAEWEAFEGIGSRLGISLVEDAAQAIGASRGDRAAGAFGNAAAFSFYPTKNLGGMGDGGMVTTMNGELARRTRLLRAHGDAGDYSHLEVGVNSRLDAFQAAVLLSKLARLDEWTSERRNLARGYAERLGDIGSIQADAQAPLHLPSGEGHVFHLYVVRSRKRDELAAWLRAREIGCGVYYPVPLHQQPCFSGLGYKRGAFPEAEKASAEVLALPMFPGLTQSEQDQVCDAVALFHGSQS